MAAILVIACTGTPATPSPAKSATTTATPTGAVTPTATIAPTATVIASTPAVPASASPPPSPSSVPSAPAGSLDPSQSDAGVVGQVTVTNDTRAGRDGTYGIVGVDADGSSCEVSFAGDEYSGIAANQSAPDGQLNQMSVDIAFNELPAAGEQKTGITDGRVNFGFAGGFIGRNYTGEPKTDARTTATINVTRQGAGIMFDYVGTTWDAVSFSGQLVCADAGLGS